MLAHPDICPERTNPNAAEGALPRISEGAGSPPILKPAAVARPPSQS